jgi:predicted AAA+ superfamily ATPase
MLVEKILGQYVEYLFGVEYFWRDRRKNEVDVVLKNKTLIPVEIKYQNHVFASDLKSLLKFMEKFDLGKGIVVTKNLLERRFINKKEISYCWPGCSCMYLRFLPSLDCPLSLSAFNKPFPIKKTNR